MFFSDLSIAEVALRLAIGTTVIALFGEAVARVHTSGRERAGLWKAATVATICLLCVEASGLSIALGQIFQGSFARSVAAWRATQYESSVTGAQAINAWESIAPLDDLSRSPNRNNATSEFRLKSSHRSPAKTKTHRSELPGTALNVSSAASSADKAAINVGPATTNQWPTNSELLGSCWILGVTLLLIHTIVGSCAAHWFRLQAKPTADTLLQRLRLLQARLGSHRRVRLYVHHRAATPLALGWLRPAILLPPNFEVDFSIAQQDTVLAHELSHLASFDNVWRQLNQLGFAIIWWCPAAWLVRHRLLAAMELAADEASLHVPDGPRHLAEGLVKAGRILALRPQYGFLSMAGHASRSELTKRVSRLLQLQQDPSMPTRPRHLVRCGVFFLFLFCAVLPGVVARAERPNPKEESSMQLLKTSWNRSLAASLLVALTTTAHADEPASAQDDDAVAIEAASGETSSEAVATAEDFDIPAIPSGVDDLVAPESNEAVADDFDVSKPSQETRITRERRQLQRRLQEIQERLAALDREQLLAKSKRRTKSILKRPRFKLPKSRLTAADVNVVSRPLPADEFGGAYVPANPATMQFVVGSKRGYEIVSSGMRRGTRPYADRTYKVMRVDRAFASLPFLQTLNSDKGIESSRFSTVLSTEEACYVFLAIDERAIEYYDTNGTPSWLNEYAPTGHTIDLNEEYMQRFGNKFIIFARKAPAGTISLGPPGMNAATNSMYFAFFATAK